MLDIFMQYKSAFLSGFGYTLLASLIALAASLFIGLFMAVFQISENKFLNWLSKIYVTFFKNIPLLIIAMFFYIVVPIFWIKMDGFTAGTIGLSLYTSAFIAETIRAGLEAVPKGQMEAARSTGLTFSQAMITIIMPQALKIVIPPLGNQFINLIKNSSVLALVAGLDIMYQADLISSETFNVFDTYLVTGIFYLILTMPMSYLMKYLEKKWSHASH